MNLIAQIQKDMIVAKKEKMKHKALLLSTVYGEASAIGKNKANRQSTDEEVIKVITKFIKNNNETITILKKSNKDFLNQETENMYLEEYLPKQLTEDELTDIIKAIIVESGATSPKQMGLVMKELKAASGGLYDGKMASTIVRKELK
jgi:uncharacterized protein